MMATEYQRVRDLCAALGDGWTVQPIDYELCPHFDFGDGFHVDVSGASSACEDVSVFLLNRDGELVFFSVCPRVDVVTYADAMHEAAVTK